MFYQTRGLKISEKKRGAHGKFVTGLHRAVYMRDRANGNADKDDRRGEY